MEVEGNNDFHPVRFTAQKFSTGVPIREKGRWIPTPGWMQQKGESFHFQLRREPQSSSLKLSHCTQWGIRGFSYKMYEKFENFAKVTGV